MNDEPDLGGRPPHEPTKATRELVTLHTTIGTTQSILADMLEIDEKTLRKHYRKELDHSKAKANATVGGALFNKAVGGDTAAQIFWMKTQAGWRETHVIAGDPEAPLKTSLDLTGVSTAALLEVFSAFGAGKNADTDGE